MLDAADVTRAPRRSAPPTWLVVALACAGQFLVVLDVAVVNVALPSMRADLGLNAQGLQWVVNAYAIAFAGFMLLGGRAGDLYGRKRMFLVGLGLFTLASLAGGLAQQDWQLLAARGVQGLGAAVLAPSTLTILTAAVPVGAVVLAGAVLWLAESRAGEGRRLDLPGAVLVTAGLATLAFGISQTEAAGWTAPDTVVPLLAGLALIGAFLAVEARTAAPLMPLGLLRVRAVASANAAMFLCGSAMFCMWFFMTLYAQNVLHYTPLEAGLALVPSSLAVILGSKVAPRLMRGAGPRAVAVAGTLVAAVGFGWQSMLSVDGGYVTSIMVPGILMMLGAGLAATPLASLATSGARPEEAGLVSGLVNTSRTMGGSLGLAVMSTIAAARSEGSGAPGALTEGYALVFRTSTVVLLVGAVLMLVWLPRKAAAVSPQPSSVTSSTSSAN
ncbi:MFS transporter [Streptomyces chartreusis]